MEEERIMVRAPRSGERVSRENLLPFPGFLEIDESPDKGRDSEI